MTERHKPTRGRQLADFVERYCRMPDKDRPFERYMIIAVCDNLQRAHQIHQVSRWASRRVCKDALDAWRSAVSKLDADYNPKGETDD